MARNFSNEPDANVIARLPNEELAGLLVVTAIASAILALWFIPALDKFAPGIWSEMTANTATMLLVSAASLGLARQQSSNLRRRLALALAALVLLFGVAVLTEYAFHISLGFDRLLPYDPHRHYPGRPLPEAGLWFLLLGVCLLTLRQAKNIWSRVADVSTLSLHALNFVVLGGDLFSAIDTHGIDRHGIISPQTLLAFFSFGTVIVLRRAEQGELFAVMVNVGIGSRMVRLIAPFAVLVPFALLAVETYLFKSGLTSETYAQAIVAASAATLALCFVAWSGSRINALERDLRDLSLTDELTDVYNRRGFYFLGQQAIREAQRAGTPVSLFFFDLDGLKRVNDLLGHETGSEMIRAFSDVLRGTFRKSDIIGRVGGDEFAVITIRDEAMWLRSVQSRLESLTDAHNADALKAYKLRFSSGYAELEPGQVDTLDSLVTRADGLMYEDKAKRKLAA
jgi:diguanylate cyclase (GGDEF)-like protein